MEVVAICSSPRVGGNTATLVEAMLEGAREAGTETVRFDAAKLKIGDCDADRQCLDSAEARCVLDDDMQEVYTRLQGANLVVDFHRDSWRGDDGDEAAELAVTTAASIAARKTPINPFGSSFRQSAMKTRSWGERH